MRSLADGPEVTEPEKPEVEAMPPLGRDVFNYLEPREGVDGEQYFRRCASCANFVPEAAMHGAKVGDRCAIFGSSFPIKDDDTCHLWAPWSGGVACPSKCAQEMIAGMAQSLSPWSVGYKSDTTPQCRNCRQFDVEGSKCRFFGELNEELPKLFMLLDDVKPCGSCDGFAPWPAPDPIYPMDSRS